VLKNFSLRAQRRKDILLDKKEFSPSTQRRKVCKNMKFIWSIHMSLQNKRYSWTLRALKKTLRLCVLCEIIYINSPVAFLFVTVMQEQVSLLKKISQRAQRRKVCKNMKFIWSIHMFLQNKRYSWTLRALKKTLRLCVLCEIIYINSSVAFLFVTVMQEQVSLLKKISQRAQRRKVCKNMKFIWSIHMSLQNKRYS